LQASITSRPALGHDRSTTASRTQNPSFIGAVLNLKPTAARVYLPPDANTFLSTIAYCFKSKNYVNLMAGSKQPSAVFLTADEAENHYRAGGSIWKFASHR
jgi:xylulose-5-phosphate/fructose-6-phosphate phosphoketolase